MLPQMIQLVLLAGSLLARTPDAATDRPPADPTKAGRALREQALTLSAKDLGFEGKKECAPVYGAVMDWPLDENVVTVVAFCDGSASLYTTSTFGVIGGHGHERVRAAAIRFVRDAGGIEKQASLTTDRSYPQANRVRFFLRTKSGLKMIEDDRQAIEDGRSKYSVLFNRAQEVISELRQVVETGQK
jgi:hypothetical protein